jgi:hypothetical protein
MCEIYCMYKTQFTKLIDLKVESNIENCGEIFFLSVLGWHQLGCLPEYLLSLELSKLFKSFEEIQKVNYEKFCRWHLTILIDFLEWFLLRNAISSFRVSFIVTTVIYKLVWKCWHDSSGHRAYYAESF